MFAERIESKGAYTPHCPARATDANAEAATPSSGVPSCPRAELLIASFIIADESENCYCVNNTIVNAPLCSFYLVQLYVSVQVRLIFYPVVNGLQLFNYLIWSIAKSIGMSLPHRKLTDSLLSSS